MLKVSILTIGDEICIGQVVNTNASLIASELTQVGAHVILHSVIEDDADMIKSEISRLAEHSDMIITTGGLGPTHDDITKSTLCEYFGDHLIMNHQAFKQLEAFFSMRNITVSERNQLQAFLPSQCTPLENKVGTAPGMRFDFNDKILISLPGVPHEVKYITAHSILDIVREQIKLKQLDVILYKSLLTSGVPESTLADKIGNIETITKNGSLAFLPNFLGVRLRVGMSGKTFEDAHNKLDKAEQYIRSKVNDHIFGIEKETLAGVIGTILSTRNETIAVAESCTGGMLGAKFTETPGSSKYFLGGAIVYSNEIKNLILGVENNILDSKGAVSEEVAILLAENVRSKFNTDYGIGITGIAGPDGGSEEKPVGSVWIAYASKDKLFAKLFKFGKNRENNRNRAIGMALNLLYEELS